MECYLAMQNEAIDHEKSLKGGMCNIYIYPKLTFISANIFGMDEIKRKRESRHII